MLYFCATSQTDARRARFRADATHDDDKLVSCLELNCHNIRARLRKAKADAKAEAEAKAKANAKAKASASTSGRAKRARSPADEGEGDNEDGGTEGTEDTGIAEIARGVGALDPKSKSKGKGKGKARAKPKAEAVTAAATSTPARGRPKSRGRPRVQAPRSDQESDGGSSKADNVKTPAVPATPAPRRRRRSDAKPRSAASSLPAGKAMTSPPSSPNARGRKPPSVSKMDSVEIITRSRSATRSRVRGNGAETGDEKTEGRLRKRRRVAHDSTA